MKINILVVSSAFMLSALGAQAYSSLDKVNSEIERVNKEYAPDSRQILFNVSAHEADGDNICYTGFVSEQWVADTLDNAIRRTGVKIAPGSGTFVYPYDKWALPRISVASLRTKGAHSGEMATQALMGMPLRVLENSDEWSRVQTPDGYIAWVPSSSLAYKTPAEMDAWRNSRRMVVTTPYQTRAYTTPTATGLRDVVTDLVLSNIVVATDSKPRKDRIEIELPDGRRGWVDASAVTPIEEWAAQEFNPETILDIAYSMEGTPYLWGGTSVKSLDCSGLAKTSYLANGLILMRDASQQALTGTRIEPENWRDCQAGDLLFFGTRNGRVTHVAIYDHDGSYVHSSGRVKRNSVDPESDSYLSTPFLHAVRINGNQGTRGITRAAQHPWYFNK